MMNTILSYSTTNTFILLAISLLLGIYIMMVTKITTKISKNMQTSLIFLPVLVCMALLAVNGSLGTSIAIVGVFGLVRFRSIPGNAKDIINIFYAMLAGLLTSTGYYLMAIIVILLIGIFMGVSNKFITNEDKKAYCLKILIPENLNFENLFDEVLNEYFETNELKKVKTANMGVMYELEYEVIPKANISIKGALDKIRTLNGNLNVSYFAAKTEEEIL